LDTIDGNLALVKNLIFFVGVVLLLAAMYFHFLSQANVIKKIEIAWFERLFSGSRASIDNLTEEGKRHRRQSNLCAVGGLLMIALYLFLNPSS